MLRYREKLILSRLSDRARTAKEECTFRQKQPLVLHTANCSAHDWADGYNSTKESFGRLVKAIISFDFIVGFLVVSK